MGKLDWLVATSVDLLDLLVISTMEDNRTNRKDVSQWAEGNKRDLHDPTGSYNIYIQ